MRSLIRTVGRAAPLILTTAVFCDEKSPTATPLKPPVVHKEAKVEAPKPQEAHVVQIATAVEDDDAEWEEKKKNCSFCRHFLESPCRLQFKAWSKCVEKCKEDDTDFVEICSPYTRELVTCTSLNPEHFKEERDAAEEEEEEQPQDGAAPAAAAAGEEQTAQAAPATEDKK